MRGGEGVEFENRLAACLKAPGATCLQTSHHLGKAGLAMRPTHWANPHRHEHDRCMRQQPWRIMGWPGLARRQVTFPHRYWFSVCPVLAGLSSAGGDGLKILDVRRRRSRLVSKISGPFEQRKGPRSGPDCGSPFFWVLFFGEAKIKCLARRGETRQGRQGRETQQKPAASRITSLQNQ